MSFAKAFGKAIQRSIEVARDETARVMRMEVSPSSKEQRFLKIYSLTSSKELENFATGADSDMGGLSQCRLAIDEKDGKGRFFGTISSQVPRGVKIERSGYAGFRNRHRPTLFGHQTWDTTVHPFLALRVRNNLAKRLPDQASTDDSSNLGKDQYAASPTSLRAALHANDPSGPAASRAIHALGLGRKEPLGPKFYVNIQTDGPVTSDLYQHRLFFDENKGSEWQTVLIPFDDFILTNTGQVSPSQVSMMREKIRTVGISVILESPSPPSAQNPQSQSSSSPPQILQRQSRNTEEDDWARDGSLRTFVHGEAQRGSKRGQTFNFDIGLEAVYAVADVEEAARVWET
ncbi:NADH:ubiquinone oxidoreductase complex I intermediate-associated protein 30 [Violaceomyces palustris]|uniref:NADH:ubiquinone oxidoreductase complex I intermediate-associated protein 30 n=1 Tax=Violaceomyces palustris TaxID=1673888 RepID=A0ACD0P6U1_9BASI|nr:NADH:ubiquinone oxidoreductase complex I intermediate-associated protein 30 [Violaceomyces palustris]